MSEITVAARKFQRLLDYLERIGLDAGAIAVSIKLSPDRIAELDPDAALPARQYSRLYKEAVRHMQTLKQPLPWAAGVGSEAFELMCHCMISARTLDEALALAARYEHMLYPMIGHRVEVQQTGDEIELGYRIRFTERGAALAPEGWDRAESQDTVAKASGLLIWHSLCGWLVGEPLQVKRVSIAAPYINVAYSQSLARSFHCPVAFDGEANHFVVPAQEMDRRVVHTSESLQNFLDNAIYELLLIDRQPASTSIAIKSLIAIDLPSGLPSFTSVAEQLHMSESSLRRRLQRENTSYQNLKDEVRCQVAVEKLLNEDIKVAQLSDFLGYTEPSSFVRSFKSWTGETPKSYRDKMTALAPH
jgi:AraC-like DNA-binding protein